jgi:hypothetical protein
MKLTRSISRIVLTGALVAATLVGTFAGSPAWAGRVSGSGLTALSADEAAMLTYMREEEKMARDVYLVMYQEWGAAIFFNIAASEQRHMDTMKKMLDKYGLPDSAQPAAGVFTNPDLQEKYDLLVSSGSLSCVDGLYAGATIEEIEMIDIQHAIDITTHRDLLRAYQNLLEGSKNHLRAFVRALAAQGITCVPQYISQELYDAIIGS